MRRPRQPQGSLLTPRWREPDSNPRYRVTRRRFREGAYVGSLAIPRQRPTSQRARTRTDIHDNTRCLPRDRCSDPVPSTGESDANSISWIRVGAGGLGSQRGCAGLQLDRAGAVRVARFVCSDSSAAAASGGASGSNALTLSCCSEYPAAATRLGSYGANSLLRWNTAWARSPRSGAPLFPRNPKAGPSFPCAWAFGERRWRGRRQVAIGPPGLFGLARGDDLSA